MTATDADIRTNIERIEGRIAVAARRAHRDPACVRLIPVTKSVGIPEIRALIEFGYRELAENRLDVARPKMEAIGEDVRWHMVGTIQRRKAREIVALFDRIDAVDRISLAEEIDKRCAAVGKRMPILVQVNVSGEDAKSGFSPGDTPGAVEALRAMAHIEVEGLMTMAPLREDPEDARPVFAGLKELAGQLGLAELSMGMSKDFEVAVEEGATEVRIGTALFTPS